MFIEHKGCVWLCDENERIEKYEKECEKREQGGKYSRYDVLLGIREV